MKIAIAIPNHNQNKQVRSCIHSMMKQRNKPSLIYVMCDAKPWNYNKSDPKIVVAINHEEKGRCSNRNKVINLFLNSGCDALIFLDGDCCPATFSFIGNYCSLFKKYDLVFGTRRHTDIEGLSKPPSDILTANMDNLWNKQPINYNDLRVISGAVTAWQDAKSFDEKIDLMLTGMIGWSCNFGLTKLGCLKLKKFMEETWNVSDGIFDSNVFNNKWGYEDVAMGIDSMFAGLNVTISPNIEVIHKSHNRSDGLFDHIRGRHIIMERYRILKEIKDLKNRFYILWISIIIFFFAGLMTGMITVKVALS